MEKNLPVAVVANGENFVARELVKILEDRGIRVEVVGETINDLSEIDGPIRYFFDFGEAIGEWPEVVNRGAKLCVVRVNDSGGEKLVKRLSELEGDWRLVMGVNVYGAGMAEEGFLGEALALAARNKNLRLPKLGTKFRLVAGPDMVEAIMRASILSGTAGKTFWVAGDETDSKKLAEILVDEAKMTRLSVIQETKEVNSVEESEMETTRKILRWKPEVGLREGLAPVVADLVMRVDEEGRKKDKRATINDKREEKKERFQEVVVEEEELDEKMSRLEDEKYGGEPMAAFAQESSGEPMEEIVEEVSEPIVIEPLIRKDKEISRLEDEKKTRKKEGNKLTWFKKIKWVWIGAVVAGIVGGLLTWPVVEVLATTFKLGEPLALLADNRISEATKKVTVYKERSQKAGEFLQTSIWGKWPILNRVTELSQINEGVWDLEEKVVALAQSADKINQAVFEEGEIDWTAELDKLDANLGSLGMEAGVVAARLAEVRGWIPGRWKPQVETMIATIKDKITVVEKAKELVAVMPELLGLDGKRREYMVLLQNEMEIRASGGFIGSYAILSFEGGHLLGFEVRDIYEADGQLKGHVEPPEAIKQYLGEAGWYMRDANFAASFPQAAKEIQWFLEKETGRRVDGVMGVDLAVAKMILGVTGEIYVPDFKEKINKDNLYEQAEFWAETKFFPGSVQKASFLGGLGSQLFEEIRGLKSTKRWELLQGIMDMADRNEIQLAVNQAGAAGVMADLGWDGAVYGGKCSPTTAGPAGNASQSDAGRQSDGQAGGLARCYADYLYVVESNFGVNKANYFLYRNMEEKIDLTPSLIKNELRINYENTAKNSSWPGGDYKNYLRVYVPVGAEVTEVAIEKDGGRSVLPSSEIKIKEMYGRKEVGFLVTVPITKKVTVVVKYQNSGIGQGDKFSYLQYVQRQPGLGDTALTTLVSMPDGWQPVQVTPVASMSGGKILFNQKLDRDLKMGIEIGK